MVLLERGSIGLVARGNLSWLKEVHKDEKQLSR